MKKIHFSELKEKLGPLVHGEELRRLLGFGSAAAFSRAVRLNKVGVEVFSIPERRGVFAYSQDVIEWLELVGNRGVIAAQTSVAETQESSQITKV